MLIELTMFFSAVFLRCCLRFPVQSINLSDVRENNEEKKSIPTSADPVAAMSQNISTYARQHTTDGEKSVRVS